MSKDKEVMGTCFWDKTPHANCNVASWQPLAPEAGREPAFMKAACCPSCGGILGADRCLACGAELPCNFPAAPEAVAETKQESVTMSIDAFAAIVGRAEKAESSLSALRQERDQLKEDLAESKKAFSEMARQIAREL